MSPAHGIGGPLSPRALDLLRRADLASPRDSFGLACYFSRKHAALTERALKAHGAHGPQVSGIIREHFPAHIKTKLRALARLVSIHSDTAYSVRPARVRLSTMRELSRAVAARDGSGYYGPHA